MSFKDPLRRIFRAVGVDEIQDELVQTLLHLSSFFQIIHCPGFLQVFLLSWIRSEVS